MKTSLLFIFILTFSNVQSQDSLKMKQIDALVSEINLSMVPRQRDTIIQNYPELGLKMITYLAMASTGGELLKYVNQVNTTMRENGIEKQMTTSSTFYYRGNKLIKVEEYMIAGGNKQIMDWYYEADKPLHYTLKSDQAAERATTLLIISSGLLKQIIK